MLLETGKQPGMFVKRSIGSFIGEQVDRSWLDELSDQFYNSNYDISKAHAFHFLSMPVLQPGCAGFADRFSG